MKTIKTLILVAACLSLSGCFKTWDVVTKPVERATLDVARPAPLTLRPVEWKVFEKDQVTYFALDTTNFSNLAKNTEDAQNRLFLQNVIIDKYELFYETPVDKN